jgi:hypothetical protein
MKTSGFVSAIVLGTFLTGTSGLSVTLKVDVLSATDTQSKSAAKGRNAGTPEQSIRQSKSLQITLTNPGSQAIANLTVLYYVFAKDVHGKELVLAKKGAKTVSLKSLDHMAVETEPAVLTSHSSHSKTVSGKTETTPASGYKFYGYGVRVLSGKQVLVESFDPPELRGSTNLPESSDLGGEQPSKSKK